MDSSAASLQTGLEFFSKQCALCKKKKNATIDTNAYGKGQISRLALSRNPKVIQAYTEEDLDHKPEKLAEIYHNSNIIKLGRRNAKPLFLSPPNRRPQRATGTAEMSRRRAIAN